MRLFYDTNVVLDLLANRLGFATDAEKAIACAGRAGNRGLVSALTICDVVYVLRKAMSWSEIGQTIKALREIVEIIDVPGEIVLEAFDAAVSDYEDTVQYLCAAAAKADVIITRDKSGFTGAKIRVCSPQEFLQAS